MPISHEVSRRALGSNEHLRSQRQQPVSGHRELRARGLADVRRISNRDGAARNTMATTMLMLLAGQAVAGAVQANGRTGTSLTDITTTPRGSTTNAQPWLHGDVAGAGWSVLPGGETLRPPSLRPHFVPDVGRLAAPLEELAAHEALAVAEESLGAGRSLLWQGLAAWFATPCRDLDQYANGFWKLAHPPARVTPSFFSETADELSRAVMHSVPTASASGQGVERALAVTWASGLDDAGRTASTLSPYFSAIGALTNRSAVEGHIVDGVENGNPLVLRLHRYLNGGVLSAGGVTRSDEAMAVYQLDATHPDVLADKAATAVLLESAGVPAGRSAEAAETVFAMEQALATAPTGLLNTPLSGARAAFPSLPWSALWQAMELEPARAIHIDTGACRVLSDLLRDRSVDDWKLMLTCQQARRFERLLSVPPQPDRLFELLEASHGGRLLLSSWYAGRTDPGLAARAGEVFEQLKAVFVQDIADSALSTQDRILLTARIQAIQLITAAAGDAVDWSDFQPSTSFVHNMLSLAARGFADDRRIVGATAGPALDPGAAHHLILRTHVVDDRVYVSPGLLAAMADSSASREQVWGRVGKMLGHELAHVMAEAKGLEPEGVDLLHRENAALRQRIDDLWVNGVHLNATAVLDEAGCDLRGMSVALRAGRAEAEAAGEAFDERQFFLAGASIHAANPTARQLQAQVDEDHHPPGPFRAGLGRFITGFDQAFGCEPRPSAPFDRIFTLGAAQRPGTTTGPEGALG